jgi:hypothetical protein
MIHDYWMHKTDDAFIRSFLPSIQSILGWHHQYINDKGMLGKMPYWNFVDWPKEWPWKGSDEVSGVPSGALEGNSSILTLQYVLALQKAAELYQYFRMKKEALASSATAMRVKTATYNNCWSSAQNLLADTPDKTIFSQHAQAMAVLTEAVATTKTQALLAKTLADTSLIQCTYYYRFYLLQALTKAGLGNEYLNQLTPWKDMLKLGLTTFAERPEPTRSDCHAWSASPCYDFLATVCGIKPSAPGFTSVLIEPHPGNLTYCEGSMPHPKGIIYVKYETVSNSKWAITIDLPAGVQGNFVWKQKKLRLKEGKNSFNL